MASSRRPGTNEDVKTFGAAGYGRDYTSLATWEDATDIDCVTGTTSPVLECYKDAGSYAISSGFEISGADTSATYFRVLRAASGSRHSGVPGSGVKFACSAEVTLYDHYLHISDLEWVGAFNSSSVCGPLSDYFGYGRLYVEIVGCLFSATNSGSELGYGLKLPCESQACGYLKVVNCIAYDCDGAGFYLNASASFCSSCTSAGNGTYGFRYVTYEPIYKNCIASGNATADWNTAGGDTGTTHNLSGDATAPAAGTYYRSKTLYFMAAQGRTGDYRIAPADLDAKGKGTDLSADGTFAFDDDSAFNLRSGAWDLGASNYAPAGSSRRVGLNEQISTFGDTGFGRDYTSVYTWEDTTDTDLVAARESEVLECYKDAASYAGAGLGFLGATTNSNYFRLVRAASSARHLGVPGTGVKFVPSGYWISQDGEAWLGIEDLEFAAAWNSEGDSPTLFFNGSAPYSRIVGILLSATNAGAGVASGISSTDLTVNIINCVVHDCEGYGIAKGTNPIHSCTAVGCGTYGYAVNGGAGYDPDRRNCIGYGCGTADFQVTTGYEGYGTHNLSEDTTAPGTVNYRNKSLTFEDAANGDCRLVSSDTDAIDKGIDLSTDPIFPFTDDIAFTIRPVGALWDLGAFEYVSGAAQAFKGFLRRWRW